jgi:hypothetical protein
MRSAVYRALLRILCIPDKKEDTTDAALSSPLGSWNMEVLGATKK